MATTTARTGVFTYDDFCHVVNGKQKADLME